MKRIVTLILLLVIVQTISHAQSRKKAKKQSIYAGISINYTPPVESYSFFSSYTREHDLVLLTYLTATSGIFITDEEGGTVTRELATSFSSQLINIGASVQFVTNDALFHRFSLTKLSLTKSSYINKYVYRDLMAVDHKFQRGYEERAAAIGVRYELGRYFGKRKKAKMKFGLSGAIEPSFYSFKRKSLSIKEFPITANIFELNIAIIPMLSAKLSKKLSLEFKVIPNILIADFEKIREGNPLLSPDQQKGIREYNLPEVSVGGNILFRYLIKEPKKRKRKVKKETTEDD